MNRLARCFNIADLREAARKHLPKGLFEFIDRGSEDEWALAENREAFRRLKLRTRFLVDLTNRDMGIQLFGKRAGWPMAVAPTGMAGFCWHQGELALAKAAADAGIPFTLTSTSNTAIETIAREAGGRLWFQVYMWKERQHSCAMIARARDLGFEALVVTIDSALGRNREYNYRNGFNDPFALNMRAAIDMLRHPRWLAGVIGRYYVTTGMPRYENYPAPYRHPFTKVASGQQPTLDQAMTWKDVPRLRDVWPGKLIIKSILGADDARLAVEHGADAIVVSNHGGRSLDSVPATIDVLPEVVEAVGDRCTILLDSGIRRGSDIVKALALGAHAVLVGRATLYGTAAGGQAGATKALSILSTEFEKTMGYVGCRNVSELNGAVFARGTPAFQEA